MNPDRVKLRRLAQAALDDPHRRIEQWQTAKEAFASEASPAVVLALLDQLEQGQELRLELVKAFTERRREDVACVAWFLDQVRGLHQRVAVRWSSEDPTMFDRCSHCKSLWPCPTIEAIELAPDL